MRKISRELYDDLSCDLDIGYLTITVDDLMADWQEVRDYNLSFLAAMEAVIEDGETVENDEGLTIKNEDKLIRHECESIRRKTWTDDVFVTMMNRAPRIYTTHLAVYSNKGFVPWIPNMVEMCIWDDWEVCYKGIRFTQEGMEVSK